MALTFLCPLRSRSLCSAPRIATGFLERSAFHGHLSLCACSEWSLTDLIGWEWETNSLQVRMVKKIGPGQKSRMLVLTKRSAVSGDVNGCKFAYCMAKWVWSSLSLRNICRKPNVRLRSKTIMYTPCSRFPECTRIGFFSQYCTNFPDKNMFE